MVLMREIAYSSKHKMSVLLNINVYTVLIIYLFTPLYTSTDDKNKCTLLTVMHNFDA